MVEVAPAPVTVEQIEFFQRNGYLYYRPILTGEELHVLREEIQRLIEPRNPNFYRTDLG